MDRINLENFDWGWMDNDVLKNILIKEIFIDRIYEKFFEVEEGDIVLDIGSSVGPFAYSILNKKPKHIYCLEPSDSEFKTINKNLCGYPVTPIKKAISFNDDKIFIKELYGEDGGSVDGISFKTLLKDYNLDKIDFLKIDCEGGEYDVFTFEYLNFLKIIPKIAGEWHLGTFEEKILFRTFRDQILPQFKHYEVYSIDGVDIKWDLWNEHFIEYYQQVLIYINNK